jgi:hypothetical protein
MTYRVTFAKRFQSDGEPSQLDPSAELERYLADGVVLDKAFVSSQEPESKHSQGVLDEDDAFLGMAVPEIWEYQVEEGKEGEFEDAIRNSQVVIEFQVIDDVNMPTV